MTALRRRVRAVPIARSGLQGLSLVDGTSDAFSFLPHNFVVCTAGMVIAAVVTFCVCD